MEIPPLHLGSGCSDAYLDLRTFILFLQDEQEPTSDQAVAYRRARVHHEVGHWRRVLGSTCGHHLLLQRLARDLTLISAFNNLDHDAHHAVRSHRAGGRIIWSAFPPYNPALAGESFGLAGQFWGEMYMATESIFQGMHPWKDTVARDEIMALAMADTWLYANLTRPGFYAPTPDDVEDARAWLKGPCAEEVTSQGVLTTRLLLECASTIDEVLLDGEDDSEPWQSARAFGRRKLTLTEYGIAGFVARDIISPFLNLQTILALIDWALNPPLPMLQPGHRPVTWREFYPPARFIDASKALKDAYPHVGVFGPSTDDYISFRQHLTDEGLLFGKVDVDLESEKAIRFPPIDHGLDAFYLPLLQASAKLLAARDQNPEVIANPHTNFTFTNHEEDPEAQEDLAAIAAAPYYPFVTAMPDHVLGGSSVTNESMTNFMAGALAIVGFDAVANEVGGLDPQELARSINTNELARLAAHFVGKETGIWLPESQASGQQEPESEQRSHPSDY